jgi:plasmid segregation protein ParM
MTKSKSGAVRAIDVGFGLVKASVPNGRGGVGFMHFPSMSIPADPAANTVLGARRRDTFDVPARGALYEVGREVVLAQTGNDYGREVSDEFYRSPIYEALTKGALRYMYEAGDREIDLLVLGLPVNQYLETGRREFLQDLFSNDHDLGDGKRISVKRVLVQAQPMGGYLELHQHLDKLNALIAHFNPNAPQLEDLSEQTVLMVDPGEYTLDWLLLQRGSLTSKASGAASDAGRYRVVRAVQDALETKLGRPLGAATTTRINESLRNGVPVKLAGVQYDLAEFDPIIKAVIADPVSRLIDGLRGMHEFIDVIVIVGGHPERYREVLQERFPNIPVFVVENSVEANVRGFQIIGESMLAAEAS